VSEKRVRRRIFGGRGGGKGGGGNVTGMAETRASTKVLETEAESFMRFTNKCQ